MSQTTQRPSRFKVMEVDPEEEEFDFVAERPDKDKVEEMNTTVFESTAHLVMGSLGGGIICIHEAYKAVGLWSALVLNILLGLLVSYCMYTLAYSAQIAYVRCQVHSLSYSDLAECALDISPFVKYKKYSNLFRLVVDIVLMIDLFGSLCCYQIIMGRLLKQVVEEMTFMKHQDDADIRVYIFILLFPCALICMSRALKIFAHFTMAIDFYYIFVTICTMAYGLNNYKKFSWSFARFKSSNGLFSFLSICLFSMEGVAITLPVENHMRNPRKIKSVITFGMSLVVTLVMLVGFFGYWGFEDNSIAPVVLSFPASNLSFAMKVGTVVIMFALFTLNFWLPFDLFWSYYARKYNPKRYWLTERLFRGLVILVVTAISLVLPDVSSLMGVLGSLCLSLMGFIFPAFIEICLIYEDPGFGVAKWRLVRNCLIITFGVIILFYGTFVNCRDLIANVYIIKRKIY